MWEEILLDRNKTSEEILSEAWRGAGNMWVLGSPDRLVVAVILEFSIFDNFIL